MRVLISRMVNSNLQLQSELSGKLFSLEEGLEKARLKVPGP